MTTRYFNFNNEQNTTEVDVNEETNLVTFQLGGDTITFDSVLEFAEFYAVARNVLPENLKNWVLTEDGDHIAYVLRAGTAGNGEDLAQLVAALKAAGMSPEEIGRAVSAAQQVKTETERVTTRGGLVNSYLESASDISKAALASHYGVDKLDIDGLKRAIEQDDEAFRTSYEDDYYDDDYDESYDADDYEGDTEEDVLFHNLNKYINQEKYEAGQEYDLDGEVALRIKTDTYAENATTNAVKALFAAACAGRNLNTVVYDGSEFEGDETSHRQYELEDLDSAVDTFNQFGVIVKDKHVTLVY